MLHPAPNDSAVSQRFREQMPVTGQCAYLDHAAVGPLTGPAAQAMQKYIQQVVSTGDLNWPSWFAQVEDTRQSATELIGATTDEIALVHSTTEGITYVSEGLDWKAGDNVVIPAGEFPANVYPWMNLADKGVELRQVEMPAGNFDYQKLEDACDQRTRLVSVSWVGFANGYRLDPTIVADLAHRQGAYFLLDAIQGLGVFPLDVRQSNIDFLSADGHKWMLGPEGAGLAYIRQELLSELRPNIVGWNSVVDRYNFQKIDMTLRPVAARYEAGSQNMVGQIGLGASLRVFLDLKINEGEIAQQVVGRTLYLKQCLQDRGMEVLEIPTENQTGILLFNVPGIPPEIVRERLVQQNVICSCRGGKVRVAIHGYNQTEDFDRLLETLSELMDQEH